MFLNSAVIIIIITIIKFPYSHYTHSVYENVIENSRKINRHVKSTSSKCKNTFLDLN